LNFDVRGYASDQGSEAVVCPPLTGEHLEDYRTNAFGLSIPAALQSLPPAFGYVMIALSPSLCRSSVATCGRNSYNIVIDQIRGGYGKARKIKPSLTGDLVFLLSGKL
jgi:hypothetical protein